MWWQAPSLADIKRVLNQLTHIRRELRQLHRSSSAARPLAKVLHTLIRTLQLQKRL